MTGNIIVMPGPGGPAGLVELRTVAGEFGWTVEVARNLPEAIGMQAGRKTAAVFFHHDALGQSWSCLETIQELKRGLRPVRLVACCGFSESIDWPALCDAGAFHALWLPFRQNEVRQTLGFIWEAEARLGDPARKLAQVHRRPKANATERNGSDWPLPIGVAASRPSAVR